MTARTIDAIYLRPLRNIQGGHEVMDLTTGRVITRRKVTEIPMTTSVIKRVETMAADQGITTIKFANRLNVELRPADLIAGVDYENENEEEDDEDYEEESESDKDEELEEVDEEDDPAEIEERLADEPEDPREPTAETEEPDDEANQTDGDEAGEDDESEDNDEIDGTEEPKQRTSTGNAEKR
jgi:hypothetical protein